MEWMDGARRVGGAVWVVVGLVLMLGWQATGPDEPPGVVTWAVAGVVALGTLVAFCAPGASARWWAGRVVGVVIGLELVGAVGDRFGAFGPPGAPGVSWGDWSHFRTEVAELVPWSHLVLPAAVAATVAEATLGVLLVAGLAWRWAGKATAGLFVVYLVAMIPGMGAASVLEYAVPVLIGGALVASGRGARPTSKRGALTRRQPHAVH